MKELIDPTAAGCSRAANFVVLRNTLDGARRRSVEIKILLLCSGPESVRKVWFVPDFEIPCAHLRIAVAIPFMFDKGFDESCPFVHVARRRHVALPPEYGFGSAGQRVGHEAEFHKGLHAYAVEKIVKLVYVLPVVSRLTIFLAINAHVVSEQAMHADVFKAAFAVSNGELPLPVCSQAFVRASRTDAAFEHGVKWPVGLLEIGGNAPLHGHLIFGKQ